MSLPRIIGIDPSLARTGLVADYGTDETLERVISSKRTGPARLIDIRAQILEVIEAGFGLPASTLVLIEGYSFNSRSSQSHSLGELGGVLRVALWELGVPYLEVPPAVVKKFATGKGNAGKDLMVSAVTHRTGRMFSSNDVVDALVLYSIGRELTGRDHPLGSLPKVNLDALNTLKVPTTEGTTT